MDAWVMPRRHLEHSTSKARLTAGEMLAERLEGGGRVDAGFQHQEGAMPGTCCPGVANPVHAEGQKRCR